MKLVKFPEIRGNAIKSRICFFDALAHYCSLLEVDYEHMFIECFFIGIDTTQRIKPYDRIHFPSLLNNLYKYHGLKLELVSDSFEDVDLLLRNNQPIIVGVDIYHCHWEDAYHIKHNEGHFFIAYAYNLNEVMIADSSTGYFGKMSKSDFENGYFCYFKKNIEKCTNEKSILFRIYEIFKRIKSENYISSFCNFLDEIVNDLLVSNRDELKKYYQIIKTIDNYYVGFCVSLKFSENDGNTELAKLINLVVKLSKLWRFLHLYLEKIIIDRESINVNIIMKTSNLLNKTYKSIEIEINQLLKNT